MSLSGASISAIALGSVVGVLFIGVQIYTQFGFPTVANEKKLAQKEAIADAEIEKKQAANSMKQVASG